MDHLLLSDINSGNLWALTVMGFEPAQRAVYVALSDALTIRPPDKRAYETATYRIVMGVSY